MANSEKVILWEYDIANLFPDFIQTSAAGYFFYLTPGTIIITDDSANTGTYEYTEGDALNVKSMRVGDVILQEVFTEGDVVSNHYFFDSTTSKLIFRLANYLVPDADKIFVGIAAGYTKGIDDDYFKSNTYYEPRVSEVFSISRSKDPLYYGIMQFQSGSIRNINTDGQFDSWRSLNVFAQPSRLLIGNRGDAYSAFTPIFTGFVENDSTTWNDFTVRLQDPRKRLTDTVASKKFSQSEYPYLSDSNNGKYIPVAYGKIRNAPATPINENAPGLQAYEFVFVDTTYNSVATIDAVYVGGEQVVPKSTDVNGGLISIDAVTLDNGFSDVTVDFTMSVSNGVDIIIDLMDTRGRTPYIIGLWDITETDAARLVARNTSLYVDTETDIKTAIESVANDIDGLFFAKDSGLYSIRIFDLNRSTSKKIFSDEWSGGPKVTNNGSEYLTSAIIQYSNDIKNSEYYQVENTDYKEAAFAIYKEYKTKSFPSGLYTESDALAKADTILYYSSNVTDIVTRSINMEGNLDIELMDFVTASPKTRPGDSETFATWEILGITKDFSNYKIDLTMRFIKSDIPTEFDYSVLIDNVGDYIVTSDGDTIAIVEVA